MKYLSVILLVILCNNTFGGEFLDNSQHINKVIPAVNIEVFTAHNRITNEDVFKVQIINVANKNSNNAFLRKTIVKDGVLIQQIIVNQRVVAEFIAINQHGYSFNQHRVNQFNFNAYGNNVLGFTDFDYKVNNQFYDLNGNLVRQIIVNNYVVAQEVIPVIVVEQFRVAFAEKNFVVLKQLRSNHCKFSGSY